MKIFLFDRIKAKQKVSYDEARSMVVVAEDDIAARLLVLEDARDEGHSPWLEVPCVVLGEAAEGIAPGVVCCDVWEA